MYRGLFLGLGLAALFGCQHMPQSVNIFPPLQRTTDASINDAVIQALASNPELSGYHFQVETLNAVVRVSGYVRTIRQSDLAGTIASKVPGVKSIENNVIVRK